MKVSKKLKRIVSVILTLALIITMLPQGQIVKAADGMDINIHFYDTDKKYAGKVYMQYWQPGTATLSTEAEKFAAWGVDRYPLLSEESTEGADWYGVNIKGSVQGFQFLDDSGDINTGGKGYLPGMKEFKGDLYYKDGVWYAENPIKNPDAKEAQLNVEPEQVYYLVGDLPGSDWDATGKKNPLTKNDDGTFSITLKDVPKGAYQLKVLQDPDNFAWDLAWGGMGAGGNYELELTKTSDICVIVDPANEQKHLKVTMEAKEASTVKSPVYNADGTLTFMYESTVSNAAIGVRGNVVTSAKKSLIKAEYAEQLENGKYLYVATSGAITDAGIYKYSFYELTETGALGKKLGDPASTAMYGDSGAFVRNPVVSNIGLVTIYYPYDGEGAKVLYRSSSSKKDAFKVGDKVTDETAKANDYSIVEMKEDKEFIGGGMFAAKFYDKEDTYTYVIVNKDGVVVEDCCNVGENVFVEKDVDMVALTVESPVVIETEEGYNVKFMYYDEKVTSGEVYVSGSFNDWAPSKDAMVMSSENPGVWSYTQENLKPGVYEYKFVVNGNWISDPLAKMVAGAYGNSVVIVPGLAPENSIQVEKGKSVTLPAKVMKFTASSQAGTATEVTYELKDAKKDGVTLKDGVLTVAENYDGKTVELVISDGKVSNGYAVSVVDKMYTYTIHYYAADNSTYANRDMWIWEASGVAYNTGYAFNQDNYKDADGRTWATATYQFPTNAINLIVRSAGNWEYEEATRTLTLPAEQLTGEFWILQESNKVFTEYQSQFDTGKKRYVVVEYNRPAGDYEGWNLYTWNASPAYNLISNFFVNVNGKYQTNFVIDEMTSSVGYLLRSGTDVNGDWSKIEKDMEGDRSIQTPVDQTVVKVKLTQGSLEAVYLPFNKGYELQPNDKKIKFYYRDDDMFLDGTLATLKDVQVEINGTDYKMTYDAENERYEFVFDNATTGDYEYCYKVTPASGAAVTVLDAFNSKKNASETKSLLTYKDLVANVTVTSSAVSFDYSENMMIGVNVDNKDVEVKEVYADLSALGGDSKVAIEPELMTLTIGVTDDTPIGDKEIPVTVIDQYNKTFTGSVTVKVTQRIKTDANDFDWDEAVIYFMLTDRFCDGNKVNNDAYGLGDYNPNGPSSYHGGDFAGVTSKLDYLKDLGINTIWITPIVENILENQSAIAENGEKVDSYGYTGYWARDFEKLNAHLGTVEEFHTLIDEAHARGIRIMVDVVLNHAGYETKDSQQFKGMFRDKDVDGNDILGPLDGLPDFATERAEVRNRLIKWQTAWVSELGKTAKGNTIDYFRVDTVKHVESTTWAAFKNALTSISSDFKLIGEYYGASHTDDFGYLGSGKMDSLLDFGFNDLANKFVSGNLEGIEKELEFRNSVLNSQGTLGTFINSHDEDGAKYCLQTTVDENGKLKYTAEEAEGLSKVAASLYITAKGQPVLYYGEEIGLTGENNYPYQTNRYDMKFDNLTKEQQEMLAHYKTLLKIRNQYSKVFAKGTRTSVGGSDAEKYIAFERSYKGQNVVVGLNIGNNDTIADLYIKDFAGKEIIDVYNHVSYTVDKKGKVRVRIPGNNQGGTVVLVASSEDAKETVTANELTTVKDKGVSLVANAKDAAMDTINATWTFSASDLARANAGDFKDIKLTCTVGDASNNPAVETILKKDSKNANGAVVTFAQAGSLPVNAKVKVYLGNQSSVSYGSKVYVYLVNEGKLQEVPIDTAKVTKNGFVTLYVAQGGTYVLLSKKASSAVVTALVDTVKVQCSATTVKKGKKITMQAAVPAGMMKKVSKFNQDNMKTVQSGQVAVKVSYKTSNKKVATVSSTGVITGVKKGKATITVTVTLSDGQKKVMKKKITVKK